MRCAPGAVYFTGLKTEAPNRHLRESTLDDCIPAGVSAHAAMHYSEIERALDSR